MSRFIINPQFKQELVKALDDWTQAIFNKTDDVISIPRYWENWETSNPFRDIVDTEDLRNSGQISKLAVFKRSISWQVPYVGYVYYGFTLVDGRTIPDRQWIQVAYEENNYREILIIILKRRKIVK
jgi:hypothetical protein